MIRMLGFRENMTSIFYGKAILWFIGLHATILFILDILQFRNSDFINFDSQTLVVFVNTN